MRRLRVACEQCAILVDVEGEHVARVWFIGAYPWRGYDRDQASSMRAPWLPKVWRDDRPIYRLKYPPGWWVDITSTRTLAVLSRLLERDLTELGVIRGIAVVHVTSRRLGAGATQCNRSPEPLSLGERCVLPGHDAANDGDWQFGLPVSVGQPVSFLQCVRQLGVTEAGE